MIRLLIAVAAFTLAALGLSLAWPLARGLEMLCAEGGDGRARTLAAIQAALAED